MPRLPDEHGATGHRAPGIDKQRDTAAYWKREAMRLKPLEDANVALSLAGLKEYVSALGALHHAAHHPLKRGVEYDPTFRTDLHGRSKTSYSKDGVTMGGSQPHAHGSPPSHDARAFALLRAEDRKLKRMAAEVLLKLDEIVGEEAA